MKVEFYKHNLDDSDKKACMDVLDSYFLTTGSVVRDFEQKFANYMDAPFAVGTNSCTNSLLLCLKYFGIGPGDEVITTALTFLGTSNAIERAGAKPVYVDVLPATGNLDIAQIESKINARTKAIIPVHLYGQMVDMKALSTLSNQYNLKIIEDACHAIESSREGIRPGMLGDAACFSFYATKNITAGEGGAVICKSEAMYEWLCKARIQGVNKNAAQRYGKLYQHYEQEFLGYKFNMNNIQAALLINQLDRLPLFMKRREQIAQIYESAFGAEPGIDFPRVLPDSLHARHLFTVWVDPAKRDEVLDELQKRQIGVAVNYRATHLYQYYRERYGFEGGMLPLTERIADSTITLPFYPKLSEAEVQHVLQSLKEVIKQLS